jgi:hypothetical protein
VSPEGDEQAGDWRRVALAEYEAHRAEVLAEVQGQQQTLALGATAIGILVAGAFNVWDNRLVATVAFLAAIPLLCVFILMQWAGRVFGMMRVGAYLERLEGALRLGYPDAPAPVLTWEEELVRMKPRSRWEIHGWNEFGAVAVFVLLASGSIALGAYRGHAGHEDLIEIVVAIEVLVVVLFMGMLAWSLAKGRLRARQDFAPAERDQSPTLVRPMVRKWRRRRS